MDINEDFLTKLVEKIKNSRGEAVYGKVNTSIPAGFEKSVEQVKKNCERPYNSAIGVDLVNFPVFGSRFFEVIFSNTIQFPISNLMKL